MTANRNLILAGISGGGASGTALMNVGPVGTMMPTSNIPGDPGTALDPAFLDPGWITEDGLSRAVDLNTNEVNAYGSAVPVRIIKTTRTTTFTIGFLESNPVSLALYHELPLDAPELIPDTDGFMEFTEGQARTQLYAGVFDIVDGKNAIRALVPTFEVTGQEDFSAQPGNPITYGCTLTAYPGSTGVAIHWMYLLDALSGP
jgi:hypothetical protein